jgi:hypothetical protein
MTSDSRLCVNPAVGGVMVKVGFRFANALGMVVRGEPSHVASERHAPCATRPP